jgi:hypothetical protein
MFFNPSNRDEYVTLRPESFFEYSGSVLTTLLNNIASLYIGFSIYLQLIKTEDLKLAMEQGPREVGWDVTTDVFSSLNKVTFLKRAFDGENSYLVYGPILRSIATIENPMTWQSFGYKNVHEFYAATSDDLLIKKIRMLLDGLIHEPNSCILNALRTRVGLNPLPETLPREALYDRYGLEEIELEDLCVTLEKVKVGTIIVNDAACKIFEKDYGVK